jgi:hypothetical protein
MWYLLSFTPQTRDPDIFPVGTHISDPSALALDDAEAERFDTDVFGTADREPNALSDLRLPPKVPTLSDRLWLPPASSELATPAFKSALAALERCSERSGCDAEQAGVLQPALALVSRPAAAGSGRCDGLPMTSPEAIRVPTGLQAIVLGLIPECREQALTRFREFKIVVEKNIKAHDLPSPQSEAGLVYARFAVAKLGDSPRQPGGPEFEMEMDGVRQEILASKALSEPYRMLQELPQWGLSMAEIQGEWLMAKARQLAREGRSRELAERMKRENLLDAAVLERLPSEFNLSPGQSHLRLAWCALALRAGIAEGFSEICLNVLAHAVSFPSMRCAVLARAAIVSGRWQVAGTDCNSEREDLSGSAAANVFERLAKSNKVWREALRRYLGRGIAEKQRASLHDYLDAYADQSHNRMRWYAAQHPRQSVALAVGLLLIVLGWVWLAWAYFVRRAALHRFLPPRVQLDT